MFEYRVDNEQAIAALLRLADATENMAPAMRAIAGIMHDEVEENFAQQGRPAWLGLKKPVNPRRVGGKILQDSGRLKNSIMPYSDASNAIVGTNVIYARIQNDGGKTRPHEIRPRYKKALAFNGRVVKKVNHPGSNIPARRFMMLTPEGDRKILSKANEFLRNAIG